MIILAIEGALEKLGTKEMHCALAVQSTVLKTVSDFMYARGVMQLLPVIISPITDPLCHSVYDARVPYCGTEFSLTKSMILHKQLALASPFRKAIYIVSPNVRLELPEKAGTGRHLLEFSQVDFELKHATAGEAMRFAEELFTEIFSRVASERCGELATLGCALPTFAPRFIEKSSRELAEKYGREWEAIESASATEPFWALDHEREFYDCEDPARAGHYLNYDLVYPRGFGEALSGGMREWQYPRLLERMQRAGTDSSLFGSYLEAAKKGLLQPSAGAGFGVERLVRFICGFKDVADAAPFAKKPGQEKYAF